MLASVVKANSRVFSANYSSDFQDPMNKLVDVLLSKLVDRMFMACSLHRADLDSWTLSMFRPSSSHGARSPFSIPRSSLPVAPYQITTRRSPSSVFGFSSLHSRAEELFPAPGPRVMPTPEPPVAVTAPPIATTAKPAPTALELEASAAWKARLAGLTQEMESQLDVLDQLTTELSEQDSQAAKFQSLWIARDLDRFKDLKEEILPEEPESIAFRMPFAAWLLIQATVTPSQIESTTEEYQSKVKELVVAGNKTVAACKAIAAAAAQQAGIEFDNSTSTGKVKEALKKKRGTRKRQTFTKSAAPAKSPFAPTSGPTSSPTGTTKKSPFGSAKKSPFGSAVQKPFL